MSITQQSISHLDVKTNLSPELDNVIQKYANVHHGLSLIALSVLDANNKSISIEMKYDDLHLLNNAVEYIISIWNAYQPILSKLRSYKVNDKFQDKLGNVELKHEDGMPILSDFEHYKVLYDIVNVDNINYTFKLYRAYEQSYRVLKMYYVENEN